MVTQTRPAASSRKILWAEDNPTDLLGKWEYLRYIGHVIVSSRDFDSTAEALQAQIFDLFVVDQQLPEHGEKAYDAGSRLVKMLKEGSLGDTNVTIPFVFVTASRDWVLDCEIDVGRFEGFLGIEEKADDLTGWFDEHLPELERRRGELEEVEEERDETATAGESIRVPDHEDNVSQSEKWDGVVTEVDDLNFRARLVDSAEQLPDHEGRFPRAVISESERRFLSPGARFTWSLRTQDDGAGKRSVVSKLTFVQPERLARGEIDEALARARKRRQGNG
jgi:hypothetical protein